MSSSGSGIQVDDVRPEILLGELAVTIQSSGRGGRPVARPGTARLTLHRRARLESPSETAQNFDSMQETIGCPGRE